MLVMASQILNCRVHATDGELGHVRDLYFDDRTWRIRYMVVDTHKWLPGRKVLLSPESAGKVDWAASLLPVNLTREQVRQSPPIETHQPVSRQLEGELARYFSWPLYWTPDAMPIDGPLWPQVLLNPPEQTQLSEPDLRSTDEVRGYRILAQDGEVGQVSGYLIQSDEWVIRYFVIDTGRWLPGKKVLISPAWVQSVSWGDHEVVVRLTRRDIEKSPPFDPSRPIDRAYEEGLHNHYHQRLYWDARDISQAKTRHA